MKKTKMSFYVTLPSHANRHEFPHNQANSFKKGRRLGQVWRRPYHCHVTLQKDIKRGGLGQGSDQSQQDAQDEKTSKTKKKATRGSLATGCADSSLDRGRESRGVGRRGGCGELRGQKRVGSRVSKKKTMRTV